MSNPDEIARGIAAVERIKASLEGLEEVEWALIEDVARECNDEVDAMYGAMTRRMQYRFLRGARGQWGSYEFIVEGVLERNEDPRGWWAIERWSFRQPFDVSASTFPKPEELRFGVETFLRVLPFFGRMSVDEVLDKLHHSWRKFRLIDYAHGMRRGIDVILATARANGQDETPFHRLMEWGAAHPMPPKKVTWEDP